MRGTVVGAAVLMAAAIAGIGAFAWSSLSGGSGSKAHDRKVTRAADDEGPRADRGDHSSRNDRKDRSDKAAPGRTARAADTIDPAEAPAAPKPGDQPGSDGPRAAGDTRPGTQGAMAGGVVDPALPFGPGARQGGAAGPGAGTAGLPQQLFPPAPPGDAGSACPAGMVDVGSFCIDATEVTNAAYRAFLDARPSRRLQPAACSWNLDYTPSGGPPPADTRPVVGVDWCDAWLYCAWSGKRLCGRMGGGNNPAGAFADASRSEWHHVCTNGGASAYSYGETFDGTKCAHAGDDGVLAPVGAVASCVGTTPPYDQVFDMSGNAWEWEDSCSGEAGEKDLCRVRGGGTHSSSAEVSCAMDYLAKREQTFRSVGIRCCSNRRAGF
jgi:formylglycine-generating enzyme required for sulfatase activity